jgi:hypothetical protein
MQKDLSLWFFVSVSPFAKIKFNNVLRYWIGMK